MARRIRRDDLPFGVVVVAFGFLLNALLYALVLAHIRSGTRLAEQLLGDAGLLWPVYGTLIAINILVALLLLRRDPIGWVFAMLLVFIALLVYLVGWWIGTPEYIRMAVYSAMAIYMNQREVRAAFARDGRRDRAEVMDGAGTGRP
ncbi:MAG: hypothetical protein ABWY52_05685 [Candidatus Limnocylindrales bacterium]